MKKLKVLNLYACLGGNRFKWDEVASLANHKLEVTALELDPCLAQLYQERFPNDKVIVADTHTYLLDNYKEFDFIWSSPPCPSHSRSRFWNTKAKRIYPDISLYQQIIFLKHNYTGGYCVENVVPYYEPLIPGKKRGRHILWTNFNIPTKIGRKPPQMTSEKEVKDWIDFHAYDFYKYKGRQRIDKIARNLVDYEAGATILSSWLGVKISKDVKQVELF